MKRLQDLSIEKWEFSSFAQLEGVIHRHENPKECFLLLHGLGERGKRIYRKLCNHLPSESIIIAPNAPFPMERKKDDQISYGHTWYFYNRFEKSYFIDQTLAKNWLKDLIGNLNPDKVPLTIIGFSQGGYLAPLVGEMIPETKLVIGLACEFRRVLIPNLPKFKMVAIHGKDDEIIPLPMAQAEIDKFKNEDYQIDLHVIPDTKHEINSPMGEVVREVINNYGK